MPGRRRKHWGWGFEDEQPSLADLRGMAGAVGDMLGFPARPPEAPVPLERAALRPPRIAAPPGCGALFTADAHARARHAWGASYTDVVHGFRGAFPHAPDLVARPADEREVERVLEWAAGEPARPAVVPYGGGTSVVGGVTPALPDADRPSVSLDLGRLDGVHEVDAVSGAARIGAGALGPVLEGRLAEHDVTLRFFPQSFEGSTLGGWIATRAAGHFATGETHVDDLVESVRAITPGAGVWASRRLPGSGAGPSPDRLLLGSEGTLGVITEAWVRVRPRPAQRRGATVRFGSFAAGTRAVRALAQSGLRPANCRLVDAVEAGYTGAGDGRHAVLVLGLEAAALPVDEAFAHAAALCRAEGGDVQERGEGAGAWKGAFLRAPYLRDTLVALGVLSETFETAITWERFDAFVEQVLGAARAAAGEPALVTCRITHAYPDGAAPYFTVLAPARRGAEAEQWAEVKRAAADAILAAGGTITHHHAVGRDHRPWYDAQRPDPFAAALRAAKGALDPGGMLNPGVLM